MIPLEREKPKNIDQKIVINNNADNAIKNRIKQIVVPNSASTIESIENKEVENYLFKSPLLKNSEEIKPTIQNIVKDAQSLRYNPSLEYTSALIPLLPETCAFIDSTVNTDKVGQLQLLVKTNKNPIIEILTHDENPIHLTLSQICEGFLETHKACDFEFKTFLCNAFISRMIGYLVFEECGDDCDAETFANAAKEPQFEIFEAALRTELFKTLLEQQHAQINTHFQTHNKFEMGLEQNHRSLYSLLTKNNFYLYHFDDFMGLMVPSDLKYALNLAKSRIDSSKPYELQPFLIEKSLIQDRNEIIALANLLKNNISDFNPMDQAQKHPIHTKLNEICSKFLAPFTIWDMDDKLKKCKEFTYEVVETLITEVAPSMNSGFSTVAMQPCFESLEIAIRTHLSQLILAQQQNQICEHFKKSKEFPIDLDVRKAALDRFVTKNGFYHNPLSHEGLIPFSFLNSLAEECIQQIKMTPSLDTNITTCERLISGKAKALKLEGSAIALAQFQSYLRNDLSMKINSQEVKTFKEEFQTKGTYNAVKIESACNKMYNFYVQIGNVPLSRVQFIHKMIEKRLNLIRHLSFLSKH